MGLKEGPMAVVLQSLLLGTLAGESVQELFGGLRLALLCPCWLALRAALRSFPKSSSTCPRFHYLGLVAELGVLAAGRQAGYRAAVTSQ